MNIFKYDDKIFKIKVWKMKINKTMNGIVKIFFHIKNIYKRSITKNSIANNKINITKYQTYMMLRNI